MENQTENKSNIFYLVMGLISGGVCGPELAPGPTFESDAVDRTGSMSTQINPTRDKEGVAAWRPSKNSSGFLLSVDAARVFYVFISTVCFHECSLQVIYYP